MHADEHLRVHDKARSYQEDEKQNRDMRQHITVLKYENSIFQAPPDFRMDTRYTSAPRLG